MTGQGIFNVIVILLGTLTELWPAFSEWWTEFKYRDLALLGACVIVAGAFLALCAYGVVVEDCVFPIWPNGAWAAVQAALVAWGLFQAAQMFVRGGLYAVRRVRAAFWDILR